MRLHRESSTLGYRTRRRTGGCLSLFLSFSLFVTLAAFLAFWAGRLFNRTASPFGETSTLSTAQAAFDSGDLNTAITQAQRHLAANPDDIHSLYLLARALIYRSFGEFNRADDRPAAVAVLRAAAARRPRDPDVLAVYALTLAANNDAEAAAETAERAIAEAAPSQAIAYTGLALALNSVGSFDRALQTSERAVALASDGPPLIDALRAQALSLRDVGRYDEATATVDRALALDDHLLALHFERAQYALLLGDTDSATVSYFSVLTHDPNNIKARLRLCELSSVMRERERAIEYCQAVTQRAPAWVEGWFRLGMEYFLQGNFEQAQTSLRRCATLQTLQDTPADALRFECWYIQGQAAEIRGDCANLAAIYNEWRTIAAGREVRQRWEYPPNGPPACPW